jgi:protein-S-isoprenylcysteine O-methyltransferase Ste14
LARICLYVIWLLWAFSWIATMFWSAPTAKRVPLGRQLAYRFVTLAGFLLLFGLWSPRLVAMTQLWQLSNGWQWIANLVAVLGFALCWWARVEMGDLWSANVTRKQGHRVIDTGPYALVRHPIYTGIIIAAFASAALLGTLVALTGAVVMTFGWYLKARLEEEFLLEQLGFDAYHDYAARTAMLIPFLKF